MFNSKWEPSTRTRFWKFQDKTTNFLLHNDLIKVLEKRVIWIYKLFHLPSTQEHKETREKMIQDQN